MTSLDELRALSHPLRLRLLSLLTATALSAAEAGRELGVAQASASYHLRVLERAGRELGVAQASASYHLRVLERAGLIRVVEVERVRGGEAKRYRHEASSKRYDVDIPAVTRSPETEAEYIDVLAEELRRRSRQRIDGPALSTDAELWLDPAVWRRVVQHVGEASALLHAAAQPPRTPGTVPVSMTAALFPLRRPR